MTALIPNPRQAGVLETVRELGSVTVEALAERFGVTLQTVRRDVKLLAEAGLLARFHGGVRLPSSTTHTGIGMAAQWSAVSITQYLHSSTSHAT